MNKILIDTSVWIDAFNGKTNKQTILLNHFIEQQIELFVCPIIIQEILQGIRDDKQFNLVKNALTGFEILMLDSIDAAYGAAALYRKLRKKGITIRKSNDCLIAFYAISHNATLLHNDADFTLISKHTTLKII